MSSERIRHSYFGERECDHWECEIDRCIHKKHQKALHDQTVTTPCTPLVHSQKPDSKHPMVSRPSTNSILADAEEDQPSLAGFMFGSKDFDEMEAMVRSSNDSGVHGSEMFSGSFCSSAEFKTSVRNTSLVDNTGQKGIYTGSVDKRTMKPHGQGTMAYDDAIYEGQWVNGDWCGFGRLTDTANGDIYQGGFFDNMKHGLGVMKYADGRTYDGVFQLDKLEGKGHLTEGDGTKFWGYWSKDGVPHGRGKKVFTDGRVFDGEFEQGVMSGHGRMTFQDGSWYLGEWSDGKPNGLGLRTNRDGDLVHEGLYVNGEPIEASSMPHEQKSSGQFLLYRSSVANFHGGGTLVGPLPKQVCMRHGMNWVVKNL